MMLRRRSWLGRVIRAPWLAWQLWKIHHRAPVRWRIRLICVSVWFLVRPSPPPPPWPLPPC